VASHDAAVVVDLIALAQQHPASLDSCLGPLFADPDVLKLGFEVAGDLNKLCTSWPRVDAFKLVAGVLDLKPLWIALGLATRKQVGGGCQGRAGQGSLSEQPAAPKIRLHLGNRLPSCCWTTRWAPWPVNTLL
jgi:hypothetical protein